MRVWSEGKVRGEARGDVAREKGYNGAFVKGPVHEGWLGYFIEC